MRHHKSEALCQTVEIRLCLPHYSRAFLQRHLKAVLNADHGAALEQVVRHDSNSHQAVHQVNEGRTAIVNAAKQDGLIANRHTRVQQQLHGGRRLGRNLRQDG